jgi:transposase
MVSATVHRKATQVLIRAALRGALTRAQARRLAKENPEVLALALLAASKRIAEQELLITELQAQSHGQKPSPSTPSGMAPIYTKPNTPQRRKKPGARKGHPGCRRTRPARIDQRKTHRLKRCPCCGGRLQRCEHKRTRTIEDIPEDIQPVVTEHTIHRDYCAKCKKHVDPVVPDALPRATLGQNVIARTSWFHYGLGITIDQIIDILSYHLQTQVTSGGLIDAWQRPSVILLEWYERIGEQAGGSALLHADETGWRVNGQGC